GLQSTTCDPAPDPYPLAEISRGLARLHRLLMQGWNHDVGADVRPDRTSTRAAAPHLPPKPRARVASALVSSGGGGGGRTRGPDARTIIWSSCASSAQPDDALLGPFLGHTVTVRQRSRVQFLGGGVTVISFARRASQARRLTG